MSVNKIALAASLFLAGTADYARAADRIYWADAATRTIYTADGNGGGAQPLLATGAAPQQVALDRGAGKLYWVEADGLAVRRASVDGTSVETLVSGVAPVGLALDVPAGKMYWTDVFQTGHIQRASLDGSTVETLNQSVGDREGLALDLRAGKMYWTNRGWQSIERSNLDGSGWEFVIGSGLVDPRGIALDLDAAKLYWAELGSGAIRRANLNGSGIETLVGGLGCPDGVDLDLPAGKIYWTDFCTHAVQRSDLDGSGVEDIVTGLVIPTGIVVDSGGRVLSVRIDIKPGSDVNPIRTGSAGTVPVAILGSDSFDALQVDAASIVLAGASVRSTPAGRRLCAGSDVDRDGYMDLVCQVETAALFAPLGRSTVALDALTYDGTAIHGEDMVSVVP